MKQVRNLKNTLTKRVRPALLAVILLFTMGFSGYAPKAAVNESFSESSDGYKIKVTKTVTSNSQDNRTFNVKLDIKNLSNNDKLKDVNISDYISAEFDIVSATDGNIDNVANKIQWSIEKISKGGSASVNYQIKAKDTTTKGLYSVGTSNSKIEYEYDDRDYTLTIKSPSVQVDKEIVDPPNPPTPQPGIVTLEKTATPLPNGQYEITFTMNGKLTETTSDKADIVICIDNSGSMGSGTGSKLEKVKTAATKLCEDILKSFPNGNVRIAVAKFDKGYSTVCNFSSNYATLEAKITGINKGSGTNTQGGIRQIKNILDNDKNSGSKKYAVLFTDGEPYNSINGTEAYYGYGYDKYPDRAINYARAQNEYDHLVGNRDRNIIGTYPDLNFYSIGVFTDISDTNRLWRSKNFLFHIQNASNEFNDYCSKYFSINAADISGIFKDISDEIKVSINMIMKEPIIQDKIANEFKLPSDLGTIGDDGKVKGVRVSLNNKEVIDVNILTSIIKKNEQDSQSLSLDISKIPQKADDNKNVKISVSFVIEAKDQYYSGNNILTNDGDAILNYKDPATLNPVIPIKVKSPKVNVMPVEGSIQVEKVVNTNSKNITFDKVKFPILLERVIGSDGYNYPEGSALVNNKVERYGFELSANETKAMRFYLRGNITDVGTINNTSSEQQLNQNYITAGTYKVSEIVPMDYINTSGKNIKPMIKIKYDANDEWENIDEYSNTFTITKEHPNVYIQVTNELVNDSYWRDRSDVSNTFKYTGK